MVKVKFFASFREAVGEKGVEAKSAENIEILLEKLVEQFGEKLEHQFYEQKSGELRDSVNILVNGRGINLLEGLETPLKDNDTVAIFPPVGGG
ncbi:hypothetical protein AKJ47_00005 [candidate division MSBL1 archaeon SCGC-AAA261G05]|uniref:MoaD family protein n=2 Tax=candidate division MSBL1 TaxID=215777 RepID=A0A133V120_9EURY|nr:hypothetical protein AKJ42_01700 [candidate division MSBL1 archaeon SCGC-AAA261C02]KXB04230.1 hypothetical protein AKJ47_00005 [candidate division MSBL1 archaeon SCGC-AAA261G05]